MLKTIEGVYRDGQMHLTELPNDISDRSQLEFRLRDFQRIKYPAKKHFSIFLPGILFSLYCSQIFDHKAIHFIN